MVYELKACRRVRERGVVEFVFKSLIENARERARKLPRGLEIGSNRVRVGVTEAQTIVVRSAVIGVGEEKRKKHTLCDVPKIHSCTRWSFFLGSNFYIYIYIFVHIDFELN